MDDTYSIIIIDILEKFCKRKRIRFKYLGFRFNERGHYNQKWKCKISSSLQVFVLDEKFCSFNYLDLKLGKEYIEYKFIESIYYGTYGRLLKTERWLPPIKKIIYLGKPPLRMTCKIILRHRDSIVAEEIKTQKPRRKKINSQMEKFL